MGNDEVNDQGFAPELSARVLSSLDKVNVQADAQVYSDQRSMRLPSPAHRAGTRFGICASRANGTAICCWRFNPKHIFRQFQFHASCKALETHLERFAPRDVRLGCECIDRRHRAMND